jgi:hypothetical protein
VTSLRFPPVSVTASGMPCASVIRWCLEPGPARSTGFGPVLGHPSPPARANCPPLPATNPAPRPRSARPAAPHAAAATPRPATSRAAAARRSSPSRTPAPAATTPTGCRCRARTRSRTGEPPSGCLARCMALARRQSSAAAWGLRYTAPPQAGRVVLARSAGSRPRVGADGGEVRAAGRMPAGACTCGPGSARASGEAVIAAAGDRDCRGLRARGSVIGCGWPGASAAACRPPRR